MWRVCSHPPRCWTETHTIPNPVPEPTRTHRTASSAHSTLLVLVLVFVVLVFDGAVLVIPVVIVVVVVGGGNVQDGISQARLFGHGGSPGCRCGGCGCRCTFPIRRCCWKRRRRLVGWLLLTSYRIISMEDGTGIYSIPFATKVGLRKTAVFGTHLCFVVGDRLVWEPASNSHVAG